MVAAFTIFRAAFGYLFLVLMVRVVGRRPGKQLTPFEFVLIFFLGGLTLTGMVGDEVSMTNAFCQILTIALCHYGLAVIRHRSPKARQLLDGAPLILLEAGSWRSSTMKHMLIQDDDVMASARDQGLNSLGDIQGAMLETYGEISIIPRSAEEDSAEEPMEKSPFSTPVKDSVPMIDNTVAVGEDLAFQRRWWKFEQGVWVFFGVLLLCDLTGLFGRGFLSKASRKAPDGTLTVDYERIARASTPSIMTLHFGPNAIHDGKAELYVSDSVVKPLGAQRISPQPARSTVGNDGITYIFPASQGPAEVQIALSPSFPGLHHFRVQIVGATPVDGSVFVVP